MNKKIATVTAYVHGSDEQLWTKGEQLGMTGDVLAMFSHALDEIKITLAVDLTNGIAAITHIDDRKVA